MSQLRLNTPMNPLTQWSLIWPQLKQLNTDLPAVTCLTADSRCVEPGAVFFALQGVNQSGQRYLQDALQKGASLLVSEGDFAWAQVADNSWQLTLPNLKKHLGQVLALSAAKDLSRLNTTAITGTNGKSSVAHFLVQLRLSLGQKAVLVGTLGYGPLHDLEPATHTTPDLFRMHQLYQQWLEQGVEQVCLEASSHALDQGRLDGLPLTTGVLTNLTRDHLDYHQTLEAYAAAKRQLFTRPELKYRILNLDDPLLGQPLVAAASTAQTLTFSLTQPQADLYLSRFSYADTGFKGCLVWQQQQYDLNLPLLGRFNLSNVLAALGVLLAEGESLEKLLAAVAQLEPVPGRMELLNLAGPGPQVVVDYAHTPDALEQVLASLRPHTQGRIYCVFGCGGDRDPGKRALMAQAAAKGADCLVVTDDNPRYEDPALIRRQLLAAAPGALEIAEREKAILWALSKAGSDDLVLIAGKGHEDYQEVQGERLPFSDQQVVRGYLQEPCNS